MTPLNIAIENGNDEIVRILLSNKNIDVNLKSVYYKLFFNSVFLPNILIIF